MDRPRPFIVAALLLGACLRLAALPLPGTYDVVVWKIWSYVATHEGVGGMYGTGGSPPERRIVSFHGAETAVDYPPLALTELGLVGQVYRALNHRRYPDAPALVVAIKCLVLVFDVGCAFVILRGVRRWAGDQAARWALIAYWLNPAIILNGAALAYLDLLFVLPLLAAGMAAAAGGPFLAGLLAGVALATKPQAVVALPMVAVGVWNASAGWRRGLLLAGAGGALAVGAAIAPVALAGGLPNLALALSRLGAHDMLSGNACNLWWIVGYLMRALYSMHDMGVWAAFTAPTKILQISRVVDLGYPNPRVIGTVLAGSAMIWGLWTARRARELWHIAALGAFLVHAFATLSAQVHENHLAAAVPLAIVAGAIRAPLRPIAVTLSVLLALNLNLFYGISEDIGYALPRTFTLIDTTVLVALANCAALAWHARLLARESAHVDAA